MTTYHPSPEHTKDRDYDLIIIGAGAAGIGCGIALKEWGISHFIILERHEIGASFNRWPEEMRFITPSFTSNGFGFLDLNAVAVETSPAYTLRTEHPGGREYALYLQAVAEHFDLPIQEGIEVHTITPPGPTNEYILSTSHGQWRSRYIIWAAGEFQYPRQPHFPGAEHTRHSATINTWQEIEGDKIIIIGGYESGIDAAIHLSDLGKHVSVYDPDAPWKVDDPDPSRTLSPYTLDRLRRALPDGRIRLVRSAVSQIELVRHGYRVHAVKPSYSRTTPVLPILATGFAGSISRISDLFTYRSDGYPELTLEDESTLIPGLFLAGPAVRHQNLIFCFIYKFRQRFAILAQALATRLGLELDEQRLNYYRQQKMFLDDFSCCDDQCAC